MFSPYPMVSPCYHTSLTVTQSYNSKVTLIGALHAEKIAEAVLLNVFRISLPASLLWKLKFIVIQFGSICFLEQFFVCFCVRYKVFNRPGVAGAVL